MADNRSDSPPPAELNRGNPNHDSFWQTRGFKKRPKDWKQRIANEKAARARQLQREQKAAAREARIQRERQAAAQTVHDLPDTGGIDHRAAGLHPEYDPFRRSRAFDDNDFAPGDDMADD